MTFTGLAEVMLTIYGPLAIGWLAFIAVCVVIWRMHVRHRREIEVMHRDHREDLTQISEAATKAINENTKAMSALLTRIEDLFLRRKNGG